MANTKSHILYKRLDGSIVPGVSQIISLVNKGDGIIHWAWKQGREGEDYQKVKGNRSSVGTLVHLMIRRYFENIKLNSEDFTHNQITEANKAFDEFCSWFDKQNVESIEMVEKSFVSEENGYGGTIDVCWKDKNGYYNLCDWKNTSGIYLAHELGLSAYCNLLLEYFRHKRDTSDVIDDLQFEEENLETFFCHINSKTLDINKVYLGKERRKILFKIFLEYKYIYDLMEAL